MRFLLESKVAAGCFALAVAAIALTLLMTRWFEPGAKSFLIALAVLTPLCLITARLVARPLVRALQAVSDGIASMRDDDFSVSIATVAQPDVAALVDSYNSLANLLREQRQSLHQRELLLDTVIQTTPLAMVLTNARDQVVYSNLAARQTFLGGRKLEGLSFAELVAAAPEPLQQAVASGQDSLFTIEGEGESDIYHLSQRGFLLNSQAHRLYLLKQLTRELSRQEVETWKKVIRVIAHELNNSLAPISSLAHSGRQALQQPGGIDHLERIFRTIEERARHLHTFIDGYARFAKLPKPRPEPVNWGAFLRSLQGTAPFALRADPPARPGVFDPAQMEQVIINLVKNAHEAGAPPDSIELDVQEHAAGWRVRLLDRGAGMSDEVLRNALLPFYSTKPSGAGLGLTLCREVAEAHGGRISLANREGGGLVATLWIPTLQE